MRHSNGDIKQGSEHIKRTQAFRRLTLISQWEFVQDTQQHSCEQQGWAPAVALLVDQEMPPALLEAAAVSSHSCCTFITQLQFILLIHNLMADYTNTALSLTVLMAIFSVGPRLVGTSPFWILLEPRVTEVVVTTGAIRRAKLQSNRCHQQTNTQHFTDRMPFLSPNQQCQSTEGKDQHYSKLSAPH